MTREYREIQVSKYGVATTTCDSCGKFAEGEQRDWLNVRFHHNDWEGAAETSEDEYDACSAACLVDVLKTIVDDYPETEHPTLSIWLGRMPYQVARDLVHQKIWCMKKDA